MMMMMMMMTNLLITTLKILSLKYNNSASRVDLPGKNTAIILIFKE